MGMLLRRHRNYTEAPRGPEVQDEPKEAPVPAAEPEGQVEPEAEKPTGKSKKNVKKSS